MTIWQWLCIFHDSLDFCILNSVFTSLQWTRTGITNVSHKSAAIPIPFPWLSTNTGHEVLETPITVARSSGQNREKLERTLVTSSRSKRCHFTYYSDSSFHFTHNSNVVTSFTILTFRFIHKIVQTFTVNSLFAQQPTNVTKNQNPTKKDKGLRGNTGSVRRNTRKQSEERH